MAKELAIAAYDATASWGTSGTVTATDGLLYESIGYPAGVPTPQKNTEIGVDEEKEPTAGLIDNNEFTTQHLARYENFDQLFALVMGADSVSSPSGGVYQHDHTFVRTPTRVAHGLIDSEEDGVIGWPGIYVKGFEFSGAMGEPAKLTFHYIAKAPVIDGGAPYDQSTADAVGYHTQKHIITLTDEDAHFRINAQSGGSVAAADEACINSFNLSFMRNTRPIYCLGEGNETTQPKEEAFPDVTFNCTFSKRVDAALPDTYGLLALAQGGTALKAELLLRGGTIDASYDMQLRFRFPALTITEGLDLGIDNPNVNELEVPFLVTGAETAPTGFSGLTSYFDIQTQNTVATDYIS